MPTKSVVRLEKGALALKALGDSQSAPLAAALEAQLSVASAPFISALLGLLSKRAAEAVSADEAHEAELADDPAARDARDAAIEAVNRSVVDLRALLSTLYGATAARQVLRGRTPRDAMTLARFASEAVTNLSALEGTPTRVPQVSVDLQAQANTIQSQVTTLRNAVEAVAREEREAQSTLQTKNAALATYDRTYAGVAKMLEGAFLLAGMDELADKVRPSARKPGQSEAEEETDTDPSAAS